MSICFSNFERKILDEIPIEEQEKWIFKYDDNDIEKTFTDQKFIENVSQDTPNYNCTLQSIVTMLNTAA